MNIKDFCVVCVDDTPEHLEIVVSTLKDHLGYQVIGFSNATECMDYVKNNPVHIIVTDQNMKKNEDQINGTEMLDTLHGDGYTGHAIIFTKTPLSQIGELTELSKDNIHVIFKEDGYKKELTNYIHNVLSRLLFSETGDFVIKI